MNQAHHSILSSLCWLALAIVIIVMMPAANAMSVKEERALGAKEHQKIIAQFGVYRDQDLQTYVNRVGQRVAKESSRDEIHYTFTILNDPLINAMALPGGYIYVTRGILTHLNSESELAAVLGHEIAHVTERHALRSQNKKAGFNLLTTAAAALARMPGVYEIGSLAGSLLLRGYSREFELEADALGAQYMARAGYSPEAMLDTIEMLKTTERIEYKQARLEKRPPKVYHGFLSTHPDNDLRYKEVVRASLSLLQAHDNFIGADEFLEKLNGMTYGDARQTGVVRKTTFYHPKLGIKLQFPQGWKITTTKRGIQGASRASDAVLTITTGRLANDLTPREYLKQKMAMDIREGRDVNISSLSGFLGIVNRGDSTFGPRPLRIAVLEDKRKRLMYILTGAGKYDLHKIKNDRAFIATIFSFDLMNRQERRIARPPKLQIVRAEEGTSMEALAQQSPITNYPLDKLRVMNGLYPDGQPTPGQLIKIVD